MHIVVFGAGKSATVLIGYLGRVCQEKNWTCTIADKDLNSLEQKISG